RLPRAMGAARSAPDLRPHHRAGRTRRAGASPPLVLLHGFPDNLHLYDRMLPWLRPARQSSPSTSSARGLPQARPLPLHRPLPRRHPSRPPRRLARPARPEPHGAGAPRPLRPPGDRQGPWIPPTASRAWSFSTPTTLDAAPMAGHHNIAAAHRHHARDATQTLATVGLAPALLKTGLTRLSRSPGSQPPRRHSWPPSSEPPEQRASRRPGGNRPAGRSGRGGRP